MPEHDFLHDLIFRDGTSQQKRALQALDPAYAPVDERSLLELLHFARQYAQELQYFNLHNQPDGDWQAFLEGDAAEMLAFLQNPAAFEQDLTRFERFSRPHLVQFLTFLQIIQDFVQPQLNALTDTHLKFYLEEVLQLRRKPAIPDQVHVFFELAAKYRTYYLPEGTELDAGKDSEGKPLIYITDEALIINRAQVAEQKSVFVEKVITTIQLAREEAGERKEEGFMAMLRIALGHPLPGDPLPPYPSSYLNVDTANVAFVDESLYQLLAFCDSVLYMRISTFRQFMGLRKRILDSREGRIWGSPEDPRSVNGLLARAAQRRGVPFEPEIPHDFHKNFEAATGINPIDPAAFNSLQAVEDVYELYAEISRPEVAQFVEEQLMLEVEEFKQMMKQVGSIRNNWLQLYAILEQASQQRSPGAEAVLSRFPFDFTNEVDHILREVLTGGSDPPFESIAGATAALSSLDALLAAITQAEQYFFLENRAEDLLFILQTFKKDKAPDSFMPGLPVPGPREWQRVYELLETAHHEKHLAIRRQTYRQMMQAGPHTPNTFDQMVLEALGDDLWNGLLPKGYHHLLEVQQQESSLQSNIRNYTDYIQTELFLTIKQFESLLVLRNTLPPLQDSRWENAYRYLEEANRKKYQIEIPAAQKEELADIYAAADATQVTVVLEGAEGESPRWRTFGEQQSNKLPEERNMQAAELGLGVSSALLELEAGRRNIHLHLVFRDDTQPPARIAELVDLKPFRCLLSGEKEWQEVDLADMTAKWEAFRDEEGELHPHHISIDIQLNEQAEAVRAFAEKKGQTGSELPVLKLLLRKVQPPPEAEPLPHPYQLFEGLRLEQVRLHVQVEGLSPSLLQNDRSVLDASQPFEPFGSTPRVGSSLAIAHPEIAFKRLDSLGLNIHWMGNPPDFGTYYQNYRDATGNDNQTSPVADNTGFKAGLELFDHGLKVEVEKDLSLFRVDDPRTQEPEYESMPLRVPSHPEDMPDLLAAIQQNRPGYVYERDAAPKQGDRINRWSRYFRLRLQAPDFQHSQYPARAARLAVQLSAAIANATNEGTVTAANFEINPPYTPQIQTFSLSYTASLAFDLSQYAQRKDLSDQLLHLHPFGQREVVPDEAGQYPFLPQYQQEGELYIGLEGVDLSESSQVAILFQVAEGSANPDLPQAVVSWHYLSGDVWKSMQQGQILSDTTNGLVNSGIIRFAFPADATATHQLLPAGTYWLRASVQQYSQSVCDMVSLHTQAVSATFAERGNAPDHLAAPLPAGSIKAPARTIPAIKKVHQPYTSAKGKLAEEDAAFYLRSSERMRHKQRALSIWDYERLLLEQFPGIYKVKCLPADAGEEAGVVKLVVIPDIRGKLPFNPFEPKVPIDQLREAEAYLQQRCPPGVVVKVQNARYLQLRSRFAVRFLPGVDVGYHLRLLNDELTRFLSPWAYEEGANIVMGGKVFPNIIVNFVEERPYVDYVAGMRLFVSEDGGESFSPAILSTEDGGLQSHLPDAIWVSVRQHQIDLITEQEFEASSFEGIGHMQIELDFQIR